MNYTISKKEWDAKLQELKAAHEEADKWKNEYYLSLADTQNLRKALEEDHRTALRYRSAGFVEKLVMPLESFRIALDATPTSEEAINYKKGFAYIYSLLIEALTSEGVKEINPPPGAKFDPALMEAIKTEEGEEEGLIVKVDAVGFQLLDRLLKPARVTVSIKKKEEVKDDKKVEESTEGDK